MHVSSCHSQSNVSDGPSPLRAVPQPLTWCFGGWLLLPPPSSLAVLLTGCPGFSPLQQCSVPWPSACS